MGYLHKRYGRGRKAMSGAPLEAMGDLGSAIGNILGGISTAEDIASDPYFPEYVCRAGQIIAAEKGKTVSPCAETQAGPSALGRFIVPVRMLAYAEQNKWVYPVAIAAIIGIPMLIGYRLGEK